jgi:hypothetical protein
LDKPWLCTAKYQLWSGTPDSVRCPRRADGEPTALGSDATINHRTIRWCTRLSGESLATNSSLSGKEKGDVAIIHRTVRWGTRLSGEPTAPVANGRSYDQRATRGPLQVSNGRLGAPDCPVCTGQCLVRQPTTRSNGWLRPIWKGIAHQTATVAVRCTTRQKARIVFHVDLQRLLAALEL